MTIAVHWFRNDLRFHDNPALIEAVDAAEKLVALYIFDDNAFDSRSIGFNPMRFLLESLKDLNDRLALYGGRLYVLQGISVDIFQRIKEKIGLDLITFEQDCDHVGRVRDESVMRFCDENGIKYIEKISHTLWDPKQIIDENGGTPPMTFKKFQAVANGIGHPEKPASDINWSGVRFGQLPHAVLEEFKALETPSPENFNVRPEVAVPDVPPFTYRWYGGETRALEQLDERLDHERDSFVSGFYLPDRTNLDLLGPPTSLSAALRYGCLSIRKFYWELSKLFARNLEGDPPPQYSATSQLVWRDYFYTMSVDNEHFGRMERNPACLQIPWADVETASNRKMLERWKHGKTGYPFIDAGMRQLMQEGWIHHVVRNSVACFLTRGDLWISWTEGLNHFFKYLIDADFSVCSGNWIWVSSSTFEQLLDCPLCMCPVNCGVRLDPTGEYIRRYVPELQNVPDQYLYEPWKCPESVQRQSGCVIGKDYPERIVDHATAARENGKKMQSLRDSLMGKSSIPHCCPSNRQETQHFMYLSGECIRQLHTADSKQSNAQVRTTFGTRPSLDSNHSASTRQKTCLLPFH